jgi:Family of unknown function (DUF6011)
MNTKGQINSAADARQFIRAGNATVTLVSKATGTRFTFRVRASNDGEVHFVSLLGGPDNETDYRYAGRISREIFFAGRKVPKPGDVGADAPSSKAFAWVWRNLVQDVLPSSVEIWHEGRCGRCNRKLTVPSSIAAGIGPECAGKIGFAAIAVDEPPQTDGTWDHPRYNEG